MGDKVTFGQYRILQRDDGSLWQLGRSAIGVTYKALDTDLQRPVALKVINPDLVAEEVSRNRFLREARAAAGLRHSNIASIYHLGKDEEQVFYATEFVEGQTTKSYVARFGPMPVCSALRVTLQLSKALAAAARQQFVHPDIKPANIMIVADSEEADRPFVKLIDFGPGRSLLRPDNPIGAVPPDVSDTVQSGGPEQDEQDQVDARSDSYSLGCTLWYLLTGEARFTGPLTGGLARPLGDETPWACRIWRLFTGEAPSIGSVTSALTQQLGGVPSWEKLASLPARVRHLLMWMLRKEPSMPPASPMDLQREIEECLAEVERGDRIAASTALPLNIGQPRLMLSPWIRRTAIFGASALGLVLAFGYFWDSESPRPSAPVGQTSSAVTAADPAHPGRRPANEISGWSFFGGWDEPLRSLALAPLLSFAEPVAADPGIIGAKSWLHADSIWDAGVTVQDDLAGGRAAALGLGAVKGTEDKKVTVARSEDKKLAARKGSTRAKSQVKKTSKRYSYANYAKQPRRRVTTRSRDQGFNPLQVVRQARYHIKRAIRRIF